MIPTYSFDVVWWSVGGGRRYRRRVVEAVITYPGTRKFLQQLSYVVARR